MINNIDLNQMIDRLILGFYIFSFKLFISVDS